MSCGQYRYRLHDTTGDELGLLEHPAPNLEPRDVVVTPDGREALATARVEAEQGPLAVLLEGGDRTQAADERRIHRLVRSTELLPVGSTAGRSPWTS